MAAPVKNLVDATAPSFFAPSKKIYPCPIITKEAVLGIPAMQLSLFSVTPRFTLVERSTTPITIVPLKLAGIFQKQAGDAAIKTFPAIYRERVSSRPTEGQIFPRGIK